MKINSLGLSYRHFLASIGTNPGTMPGYNTITVCDSATSLVGSNFAANNIRRTYRRLIKSGASPLAARTAVWEMAYTLHLATVTTEFTAVQP